jgi:hypothetical protein
MVMSPMGLGPENDCAGESAAIVNDRPILSPERMLHKDCDHNSTVEKQISGHDPQGAWHQDELTG